MTRSRSALLHAVPWMLSIAVLATCAWADGERLGNEDPTAPKPPAPPVQALGLRALHRSGQTFLTWNPRPGSGLRYRVYRATQPISTSADLATATLLWTLGDSSAVDWRLSTGLDEVLAHSVDSLAGPLHPRQGLFVVTATANTSAWYAVTWQPSGAPEERTILPGDNALLQPMQEFVDTPRPVFQRTVYRNGRMTNIYTLWSSTQDTPFFPAMANRPGMAFDCAVTPSLNGQGGSLLVRPHHRGGSFLDVVGGSYHPGQWVLALDDPLPNGQNTFWFGYHPDYDVSSNDNVPPASGMVVDYTFRRVRHTLEWALQNFPVDPAQVYAFGYSMGGIGSSQLAMWLPGRFAAIMTVVGKFDFSVVDDPNPLCGFNTGDSLRCVTDRMWGTVATGLPSSDGRPTYERLDLGDVVDRAGATTIPPILSADGKRDYVVGWAEKARFYNRMQQQRRGGRFFWSPEGHHEVGLGCWQPMIDMSWLYRHRNDRSFPALSNCDLDSDPGDGSFASGDSVGCINGYVEWDTTLTDQADVWRVTLRLRQLNTRAGIVPAPESCLVDVTPERLQRLRPVAGEPLGYRVLRLSDRAVVTMGTVWPDPLGRVTVPAVRVHREGTELALGPSVRLDVPEARPSGSLVLGALNNPARGRVVLLLRGAGAGQAEVELFDVGGRLVRRWPGESAVSNERRFEARALSPGVYLARAHRNGELAIRRVVVLP